MENQCLIWSWCVRGTERGEYIDILRYQDIDERVLEAMCRRPASNYLEISKYKDFKRLQTKS